jgi:hypothetical protein
MSFSTLNAANHRNLNLLVGDVTGLTPPPASGWTVLDSAGASYAVPLTVLDSTGASFAVPANVLDSTGASFTPI